MDSFKVYAIKRFKSKIFQDGLQMQHHKFTTCFKQAIFNAWELKREKKNIYKCVNINKQHCHSFCQEKKSLSGNYGHSPFSKWGLAHVREYNSPNNNNSNILGNKS